MYFQEPKALTPSLMVQGDKLFDLQHVTLKTMLDGQAVTTPPDYLTAVASLIALYYVFNVAFARDHQKTLHFLSAHVCQLEPYKPTQPLLKVTNYLYTD